MVRSLRLSSVLIRVLQVDPAMLIWIRLIFLCRLAVVISYFKILAGCGKTPISRYYRESGSPEDIEKTGFLLSQE